MLCVSVYFACSAFGLIVYLHVLFSRANVTQFAYNVETVYSLRRFLIGILSLLFSSK